MTALDRLTTRGAVLALGLALALPGSALAQTAPSAPAEEAEASPTEAPGDTAPEDDAGEDEALAELPVPTTPTQLPDRAPAVDGPKRVLMAGDNIAFGLARTLGETLAERLGDEVEVLREAVPSSGLVRDDFHDWPATLTARLEAGDIAAVVMLVGVNDRQPLRDENGSHAPNSDEWLALYRERVDAVIDAAAAARVPLVWVGMPIMGSGSLNSTLNLTNPIFREGVTARGGAFVDSWDQFALEGGYARVGPNLAGAQTRLRTGDGVHFTNDGYEVLASLVAAPLTRLPGLATTRQARQAAEAQAVLADPQTEAMEGLTPGTQIEADADPAPAEPALASTPDAVSEPVMTAPTPDPSITIRPARPAASRPTVREVRVGRPVLLTAPPGRESELISRTEAPTTDTPSPSTPLLPPAGRIDAR